MNFRLTICFISVQFLFIACSSQSCLAQTVSKNKTNNTQNRTVVPNIVGLKLKDAGTILRSNKINIGALIGSVDSLDTLDDFIVYRQYPFSKNADGSVNYIGKNRLVDVWIENPKAKADTSNQNTRHIRGARSKDN